MSIYNSSDCLIHVADGGSVRLEAGGMTQVTGEAISVG